VNEELSLYTAMLAVVRSSGGNAAFSLSLSLWNQWWRWKRYLFSVSCPTKRAIVLPRHALGRTVTKLRKWSPRLSRCPQAFAMMATSLLGMFGVKNATFCAIYI
jgi:hypothetical protein